MNTKWYIFLAVVLAAFALLEGYGIRHRDRQNTLSRTVVVIAQKYPISLWIMGCFNGAMVIHLFANWCVGNPLATIGG